MKTEANSDTYNFIIDSLFPDAPVSRLRGVERSLSSMTDIQLEQVKEAIHVAFGEHSVSRIRDVVEARDLISIAAISRWGKMINISALEGALDAQFGEGDEPYDIYSSKFDAHVEAFATYHSHCAGCSPHDIDMDYSEMEVNSPAPPRGHYIDYLQDFDLMYAVEAHPDRVTDLVQLAAERRGLNQNLLKDYLEADASALSSGRL